MPHLSWKTKIFRHHYRKQTGRGLGWRC